MSLDVKYVPETDTIELKHSGSLSAQDTLEQAQIVLCLMKETQAIRFLLDYSETISSVRDEDARALPEYCERLGAPRCIKVALVVPTSLFNIAAFQLFAQVAQERGFSVELFPTREHAEAWLEAGETTLETQPQRSQSQPTAALRQ
jgi:hypothetical protein